MTESAVLPPFTVTPAAIDAITAVGGAVRVSLADGGGCGTFYGLDAVDADAVGRRLRATGRVAATNRLAPR